MTELTDPYGFPVLEGSDPAAIALYMQRLAEEIDAELVAQRAQYATFDALLAQVYTNTNSSTFPSGAGIFNVSPGGLVFANYPGSTGFGSYLGMFPSAGIWHIGWTCNMIATGAVTAASTKQVLFTVKRDTGAGTYLAAATAHRLVVNEQPVAAGGWFGSQTVVEIPETDRTLYSVDIGISHSNVASTMNIPIGGFVAWMYRVGSSDLIEVT